MGREAPTADRVLPFGRYNGVPLAAVPSDYLASLIGQVKLSSGIRATVAAELSSRGHPLPPAPPPRPIVPCRRCGRFLTYPPSVEPYTTIANAANPVALRTP